MSQPKSSESSRWLLAQQQLRESGIPSAQERTWTTPTIAAEGVEHVETALAECTRTEANLGALLRGLTHLSAGANAARDANTSLLKELDTMRELLGRSNEHELSLRGRVRALEQALEDAERNAALARAVLLEQEDLFLAELLTDHERELGALKRRLSEAPGSSAPALGVAPSEPPAESHQRELAKTIEELALADSELQELEDDDDERRDSSVMPISTLPPPPNFDADAEGRLSTLPPPPGFEPDLGPPSVSLGALKLRTIVLGPAPFAPPPVSAPATATAMHGNELPFTHRVTEPFPAVMLEPVVAPVVAPAASAVATPIDGAIRRESRPALKQKPDVSTRPLVGYSLGSDEIAEEVIDTSRLGPRSSDG
ncbi:MAG TPA: hypothetical protein VH062_25290 [Polyangiaceae bacterium]|jgi:hypothetical protein|nr:hypothetical protein [Polyangiaceae bacterium]